MEIVVIDYGMGNLASVFNALVFLGAEPKISSSPDELENADKLVLPGVGAFGDAFYGLEKSSLIEPLKRSLEKGKPYLGICLGLQLLFDESEEGGARGLGILKGKVKRFPENGGVKVPHIGWNTVDARHKTPDPRLMEGIKDRAYFYFDHSYYADPADKDMVAATTEYGITFASMICRKNISAVQFHPERSQDLGLRVLRNFLDL